MGHGLILQSLDINLFSLTVHLELVHVDLLEVKLLLAVLEELSHLFSAPCSRVRGKTSWQTMSDLSLQGAGGRLGQEGVGISPKEVGGEGQGEGQSVHAGGEADWRHLHISGAAVLAASLDLGEAARTLARDAETSSEKVC